MREENCLFRYGNIYGSEFGTGYAGNVWNADYISPSLMTMQGGGREPMIVQRRKVKQNNGRQTNKQ